MCFWFRRAAWTERGAGKRRKTIARHLGLFFFFPFCGFALCIPGRQSAGVALQQQQNKTKQNKTKQNKTKQNKQKASRATHVWRDQARGKRGVSAMGSFSAASGAPLRKEERGKKKSASSRHQHERRSAQAQPAQAFRSCYCDFNRGGKQVNVRRQTGRLFLLLFRVSGAAAAAAGREDCSWSRSRP